MATRVYLECGKTWVFACAVDWPGWARRGKGEEAALEALLSYTDRYAAVAGRAFDSGALTVVGRLPGNATTDFGAPDAIGDWDREPLDPDEADRLAGVLEACWRSFDDVVATAPAALRKGPRGGGRDRDKMVEHVREAERSYGRQIEVRMPPRTPWEEQRSALLEAIREGQGDMKWPVRYACRRIAWHVLDHAWEMQDRSSWPPGAALLEL